MRIRDIRSKFLVIMVEFLEQFCRTEENLINQLQQLFSTSESTTEAMSEIDILEKIKEFIEGYDEYTSPGFQFFLREFQRFLSLIDEVQSDTSGTQEAKQIASLQQLLLSKIDSSRQSSEERAAFYTRFESVRTLQNQWRKMPDVGFNFRIFLILLMEKVIALILNLPEKEKGMLKKFVTERIFIVGESSLNCFDYVIAQMGRFSPDLRRDLQEVGRAIAVAQTQSKILRTVRFADVPAPSIMKTQRVGPEAGAPSAPRKSSGKPVESRPNQTARTTQTACLARDTGKTVGRKVVRRIVKSRGVGEGPSRIAQTARPGTGIGRITIRKVVRRVAKPKGDGEGPDRTAQTARPDQGVGGTTACSVRVIAGQPEGIRGRNALKGRSGFFGAVPGPTRTVRDTAGTVVERLPGKLVSQRGRSTTSRTTRRLVRK